MEVPTAAASAASCAARSAGRGTRQAPGARVLTAVCVAGGTQALPGVYTVQPGMHAGLCDKILPPAAGAGGADGCRRAPPK